MKITEQSTKSITFVFNKDEEVTSFLQVLEVGLSARSSNEMVTNADVEVRNSIERNLLFGKPSVPGTWTFKVSNNSGILSEGSGVL